MRGSAFLFERTRGIFALPVRKAEQVQTVVVVFAFCGLFMMTSFGMTLPIFAHLIRKTSSGVMLLSLMMLIPQLAHLALAPLVGYLADRFGRFPFLVVTFAGLVLTNTGYLFAHAPVSYLGIQVFQAIVCVGTRPAMMGILADIVPEHQRTRRLSLLMAGFAGGMTLGPALGGFLLQRWGVLAPFGVSACLNMLALILICTLIPRTPARRSWQQEERQPRRGGRQYVECLRLSLVLPISFFIGLLVLDFIQAFGRAFVEPQLIAYITNVLRFPPFQLGLLLSGHGFATLLGALVFSRLGERAGKCSTVVTGFLIHAIFPFSLLLTHQFSLLFLASLLSGVGSGLVLPLLGTCFLESVKAGHQSRMSGIKEAVGACGGIAGALLVLLASRSLGAPTIFVLGGCAIAGEGIFAMYALNASRASRIAPMIPISSALLCPIPCSAGIKQSEIE
ncbi:MAG TPA: MFS transporter [Ktedonobacteraceae bacterium]